MPGSRSVEPPTKERKKTPQNLASEISSGGAHTQADLERMTFQELYEEVSRGDKDRKQDVQ